MEDFEAGRLGRIPPHALMPHVPDPASLRTERTCYHLKRTSHGTIGSLTLALHLSAAAVPLAVAPAVNVEVAAGEVLRERGVDIVTLPGCIQIA